MPLHLMQNRPTRKPASAGLGILGLLAPTSVGQGSEIFPPIPQEAAPRMPAATLQEQLSPVRPERPGMPEAAPPPPQGWAQEQPTLNIFGDLPPPRGDRPPMDGPSPAPFSPDMPPRAPMGQMPDGGMAAGLTSDPTMQAPASPLAQAMAGQAPMETRGQPAPGGGFPQLDVNTLAALVDPEHAISGRYGDVAKRDWGAGLRQIQAQKEAARQGLTRQVGQQMSVQSRERIAKEARDLQMRNADLRRDQALKLATMNDARQRELQADKLAWDKEKTRMMLAQKREAARLKKLTDATKLGDLEKLEARSVNKKFEKHGDRIYAARNKLRIQDELQKIRSSNPTLRNLDLGTKQAIMTSFKAAAAANEKGEPGQIGQIWDAFTEKIRRGIQKGVIGKNLSAEERAQIIPTIKEMQGLVSESVSNLKALGAEGRTALPDEIRIVKSLIGLDMDSNEVYGLHYASISKYAATVKDGLNITDSYQTLLGEKGAGATRRNTMNAVKDIDTLMTRIDSASQAFGEEVASKKEAGIKWDPSTNNQKKVLRYAQMADDWQKVDKSSYKSIRQFLKKYPRLGGI